MILFQHGHDLVVDGDGLFSNKNGRGVRGRVLNLVEPGVGSDALNVDSLVGVGI